MRDLKVTRYLRNLEHISELIRKKIFNNSLKKSSKLKMEKRPQTTLLSKVQEVLMILKFQDIETSNPLQEIKNRYLVWTSLMKNLNICVRVWILDTEHNLYYSFRIIKR